MPEQKKECSCLQKDLAVDMGGCKKRSNNQLPRLLSYQTRIKHGCQLGWLLEVHEGMHVTKNRQIYMFLIFKGNAQIATIHNYDM